jgi:hypothetical protein
MKRLQRAARRRDAWRNVDLRAVQKPLLVPLTLGQSEGKDLHLARSLKAKRVFLNPFDVNKDVLLLAS